MDAGNSIYQIAEFLCELLMLCFQDILICGFKIIVLFIFLFFLVFFALKAAPLYNSYVNESMKKGLFIL